MKIFHFLRSHKRVVILAIVILIILGFILRPKNTTQIETQAVKKQDITQSLSGTGSVDSVNTVNLNFLTGGKLVYLGVHKGDFVEAGQVIATLDQRTMQKNLETALRNYSEQRNAFDTTKENNQNHTPEDALNVSMKRILENNQYDLDKAIISVELQQLAREQAVLTTPIAGVVTRADVPTSGVNIGATTTFTVADPINLVFKLDIDEADIGRVRPTQNVKVILDAYPDRPINLVVTSIDFAAHTTTTGGSAYTAEAVMPDNTSLDYRVGMNGDAEVILDQRLGVLTIPLASITTDNYVYVKKEKNWEKRKVKLGLTNDTDAQVLDGVKEGELVALDSTAAEKESKNKKRLIFF